MENPNVLPDPPLRPTRPDEPPSIDVPEPPDPAEPWNQPDTPKPPEDPGFSSLIPAGNLAGLPALCLPCGFADGLPVGIQLVGNPFSENLLIAVGKAFQERTDFHRQRPKG